MKPQRVSSSVTTSKQNFIR